MEIFVLLKEMVNTCMSASALRKVVIIFGQVYIYFRCIRVILHSSERVDATLIVSYVVNDASWTPLYDIRVFTKDKTLNVLTCIH